MVFSRSDKEVPATVGDEVKGLVPPMRQWAWVSLGVVEGSPEISYSSQWLVVLVFE